MPGELGLDHFDEGVYAAAGEAAFTNFPRISIDPGIIPYGPPLTSFGIALSGLVFGGPSDFAAIVPGIVSGTFAVWLAYRLTRDTFGPEPALAAAGLLATSGVAVAFSRSAMTESILITTWLLAMLAGSKFLNRPGPGTALTFGIAVGLTQLTKYNGGLTGVIVALTAVLEFAIVPRGTLRDLGRFRRRILWGIIAAIIAAAIYAPWFLFVEDHGGYRELMRHHGSYVNGAGRWVSNLRLQLAQGWVYQAQPLLLLTAAVILGLASGKSEAIASGSGPTRFAKVAGLVVLPNATVFAGIVSIRRTWANHGVAGRMIVVWFVTMFVLTPMYHPYARLWLPLHLAGILLAANGLSCTERARSESAESGSAIRRRVSVVDGFAILVLVGITIWSAGSAPVFARSGLPTVWSDRSNLRTGVESHIESIRQATARGTAVHLLLNPAGRRALALSLAATPQAAGRFVVIENLDAWQRGRGPILVDLSLLDENSARTLVGVSRGTSGTGTANGEETGARRGLITILDLAPGVAMGEPPPSAGVVWIDP